MLSRPAQSVIDQFEKIYALAKQNDETGLINLIKSGVCINVSCVDESPIRKLAAEFEHDAVNLLIRLGGSANYALEAYACVGDAHRVDELIAAGVDQKYAIYGYSRGGFHSLAKTLLHREAFKNIHSAICGSAQGGHDTETFDTLQTARGCIYNALYGFALGQHTKLLSKALSWSESHCYQDYVAEGHARAGNIKAMNEYLAKDKSVIRVKHVIVSLAISGFFNEIEDLLNKHPGDKDCLDAAASGAAAGGHLTEALTFIKRGADINAVARSFAHGQHFEGINEVVKLGANIKEIFSALEQCNFLKHPEHARQTASFIANAELKKLILSAAGLNANDRPDYPVLQAALPVSAKFGLFDEKPKSNANIEVKTQRPQHS
jgi:hypothetical protein